MYDLFCLPYWQKFLFQNNTSRNRVKYKTYIYEMTKIHYFAFNAAYTQAVSEY